MPSLDDPPMINTTLTGEYLAAAHTFGLGLADLKRLALNAAPAALLPAASKRKLEGALLAA